MTNRNELERLQPMTTEEKALALVNEALVESGRGGVPLAMAQTRYGYGFEALCSAIEAHEADKKAFSEAAKVCLEVLDRFDIGELSTVQHAIAVLRPFTLPDPEPDLLVEEIKKAAALIGQSITDVQAANITFYFAARGYKIERIEQ